MSSSTHIIKTEVYGINENNAAEKLAPHIKELIRHIKLLQLKHLKITSKIDVLENKVTLEIDMKEIMDKIKE